MQNLFKSRTAQLQKILGHSYLRKGQNYENQNYNNQNVESQKVDQKFDKNQKVESLLFVFFKLTRASKIRALKRTSKVKNDFQGSDLF